MDEIAKRKPVNRQAANVVSKGISYEPAKKIQTHESETPIPTRISAKNVEALDGSRSGDLTVIGLARDHLGLWVCQCCCGMYVLRRAKSIKAGRDPEKYDRCERCRHYDFQRQKDEYRRLGFNPSRNN